MILRGKAHKLGDNISTDHHASNKYQPVGTTVDDMVKKLFVELDPSLPGRVRAGDILVAGETFGGVSSREDAVLVLKASGFGAVLAKSYGSLTYRNLINLGMPAVEGDTEGIQTGDELELDLSTGKVVNLTKGTTVQAGALPPSILRLVADGGLMPHLQKTGDYILA